MIIRNVLARRIPLALVAAFFLQGISGFEEGLAPAKELCAVRIGGTFGVWAR
ncbi:MAG: hypothetical protein SFW62_03670 [Alphaproteobacteria bacterium]|nr:hypothetical protein [Alphaproteobacteria bacterium]